ncbi:MAG: hypothetical protein LBN23_01835 [Paludibacter sp.]|nr:hypothetical protein [Paludibacter sp.]
MKTLLSTLTIFLSAASLMAQQSSIKEELNLPRTGDKIVKQQVEYKDPGRAGENVVWDFGQLLPVNSEYTLSYHAPQLSGDNTYILGLDTFPATAINPDSIIIGIEHFTVYYYKLKKNSMVLIGHANAVSQMQHKKPLLTLPFPLAYGQSAEDYYVSKTLYAGAKQMNSQGNVSIKADAYGMIILPDGDTLRQVLRIKTTRSIVEIAGSTNNTEQRSLVNSMIENYLWYARGQRYPVFETVKTLHRRIQNAVDTTNVEGTDIPPLIEDRGAGIEVDTFTTAFFFPPPQDELFLTPDTANLAERKRMQVETDNYPSLQNTNPWAGMYYNISPNPAHADVLFEIYLPRACSQVVLQISNQSGLPMLRQNKGGLPEGISNFTLNIGALPVGNYVLDFWLDGYLVHGGVVMKR